MAAMRLQLRSPHEQVSEEEERYRLLPAQVPVRNAVSPNLRHPHRSPLCWLKGERAITPSDRGFSSVQSSSSN